MNLDGRTIAAWVSAGAAVVTGALGWRAAIGRSLTYNRLDQLLDMHAKTPEDMSSVRNMIDAEIVTVCEKLHAARAANRISASESGLHEARRRANTLDTVALLILAVLAAALGAFLVSLHSQVGLIVAIVFISIAVGVVFYELGRIAWRLLRLVGSRSEMHERRSGGGPGDVHPGGTASPPIPRSDGLSAGLDQNLPGTKLVDPTQVSDA
jgi:multisubunit Na+/H+ antiporter MnhC subunit